MTILVSRSWPAQSPLGYVGPGAHPHSIGRGTGNFYTYPDEMWHEAEIKLQSLEPLPGSLVQAEWVRGYPTGYALLEGAVCSLDDKPREYLPVLEVTTRNPRKRIVIAERPESAS